ncbi:universal stress protein, partial [Nonomuraea ceibae]
MGGKNPGGRCVMVKSVVVGVDGSAPSDTALEWAAADARRRGM